MLHPIFADCCASDSRKYDLSEPFAFDGWAIATDGKILVRCPQEGTGLTFLPGRKVPNPYPIFEAAEGVEYEKITLPPASEHVECGTCKGTGKIGQGKFCCQNCSYEYVLTLDGNPIAYDCLDCDGSGRIPNSSPVKIWEEPAYYLMARYVGLLLRHGITEISVPTREDKPRKMNDPKFACRFFGDGFDGWLMPMDTRVVERDLEREKISR